MQDDAMAQALLNIAAVIIGFAVTWLMGRRAEAFHRRVRAELQIIPPPGASDEQKRRWSELAGGSEGGKFIGPLERFMFFASLVAESPTVIATWLAFKVASKWNAWTNITAPPKDHKEIDSLDLAIGRRSWGSSVLTTFLAGTAFNICAAMLGFAVTRCLQQVLPLLRL